MTQRNPNSIGEPVEELTKKEKDFLLSLLLRCDWTYTQLADNIIAKLKLDATKQ